MICRPKGWGCWPHLSPHLQDSHTSSGPLVTPPGVGLEAPASPRLQKTQEGPGQDSAHTRSYIIF